MMKSKMDKNWIWRGKGNNNEYRSIYICFVILKCFFMQSHISSPYNYCLTNTG